MRSIKDTPVSERVLMITHRLSAQAWRKECDDVAKWLNGNPETITEVERNEMLSTIQQPLRETEHPLVIIYCYADIPENTNWDIAFDPKATEHHECTNATLRFGVILHRVVYRSLSHGWHQVAVIDFPEGMPHLIESLPLDPKIEQTEFTCLCVATDFPKIQSQFTNVA